ncbi:AraC family transcriptional regulator [Bacillus solitudinis]|uniref:AraC family transcriptional regulator n=1 Tax=Bacillus solitudinis TaxID=2014074 RepID=UPI001D0CEA24|nr:AraC family transcriptional regulator [Bacillus solitudinis]
MKSENSRVAINPHSKLGENHVLFSGYSQTYSFHKVGPQVHDYHLLHFVLGGKGTFTSNKETHRLGLGDSFFIFPRELVTYESDRSDPWYYTWVGFRGVYFETLLEAIDITPKSPIVRPLEENIALEPLFQKLYQVLEQQRPNCNLKANAFLRLIFADYFDIKGWHPTPIASNQLDDLQKKIEDVVRLLTLRYFEPLSIHTIADNLGYHRTYFSKMFKQHTGQSPSQLLLDIRMKKAESLLQKPLTVKQIASSVGYQDSLYFSKQFKKWTGLSPTEYRENSNFEVE